MSASTRKPSRLSGCLNWLCCVRNSSEEEECPEEDDSREGPCGSVPLVTTAALKKDHRRQVHQLVLYSDVLLIFHSSFQHEFIIKHYVSLGSIRVFLCRSKSRRASRSLVLRWCRTTYRVTFRSVQEKEDWHSHLNSFIYLAVNKPDNNQQHSNCERKVPCTQDSCQPEDTPSQLISIPSKLRTAQGTGTSTLLSLASTMSCQPGALAVGKAPWITRQCAAWNFSPRGSLPAEQQRTREDILRSCFQREPAGRCCLHMQRQACQTMVPRGNTVPVPGASHGLASSVVPRCWGSSSAPQGNYTQCCVQHCVRGAPSPFRRVSAQHKTVISLRNLTEHNRTVVDLKNETLSALMGDFDCRIATWCVCLHVTWTSGYLSTLLVVSEDARVSIMHTLYKSGRGWQCSPLSIMQVGWMEPQGRTTAALCTTEGTDALAVPWSRLTAATPQSSTCTLRRPLLSAVLGVIGQIQWDSEDPDVAGTLESDMSQDALRGLEPEYECDACVIPPSSELVAQRPEDSMSVTILNEAFYLEQICEDIQGVFDCGRASWPTCLHVTGTSEYLESVLVVSEETRVLIMHTLHKRGHGQQRPLLTTMRVTQMEPRGLAPAALCTTEGTDALAVSSSRVPGSAPPSSGCTPRQPMLSVILRVMNQMEWVSPDVDMPVVFETNKTEDAFIERGNDTEQDAQEMTCVELLPRGPAASTSFLIIKEPFSLETMTDDNSGISAGAVTAWTTSQSGFNYPQHWGIMMGVQRLNRGGIFSTLYNRAYMRQCSLLLREPEAPEAPRAPALQALPSSEDTRSAMVHRDRVGPVRSLVNRDLYRPVLRGKLEVLDLVSFANSRLYRKVTTVPSAVLGAGTSLRIMGAIQKELSQRGVNILGLHLSSR